MRNRIILIICFIVLSVTILMGPGGNQWTSQSISPPHYTTVSLKPQETLTHVTRLRLWRLSDSFLTTPETTPTTTTTISPPTTTVSSGTTPSSVVALPVAQVTPVPHETPTTTTSPTLPVVTSSPPTTTPVQSVPVVATGQSGSPTTVSPPTTTPPDLECDTWSPAACAPPYLVAEWTKVAVCEEGGWVGYSGAAFPDSIGQTAANWAEFSAVAGINPSDLSPEAQSLEGNAFAQHYGDLPDQDGCGGGY